MTPNLQELRSGPDFAAAMLLLTSSKVSETAQQEQLIYHTEFLAKDLRLNQLRISIKESLARIP